MTEQLEMLAGVNISGAPFLLAYGITWLICGILWRTLRPEVASLATLFQGMIALPVALFIMYLIGAFEKRPDVAEFTPLVIIIAMSQLLVLPLLIALFRKKDFTMIPYLFSVVGSVHFLMYAWLYQTAAYIVMPIVIAFSLAIIYSRDNKETGASSACLMTGIILLVTAGYFVFL